MLLLLCHFRLCALILFPLFRSLVHCVIAIAPFSFPFFFAHSLIRFSRCVIFAIFTRYDGLGCPVSVSGVDGANSAPSSFPLIFHLLPLIAVSRSFTHIHTDSLANVFAVCLLQLQLSARSFSGALFFNQRDSRLPFCLPELMYVCVRGMYGSVPFLLWQLYRPKERVVQ